MYYNHLNQNKRVLRYKYTDNDTFFNLSEKTKEKLAPVVLIIYSFFILFLLSWAIAGGKKTIKSGLNSRPGKSDFSFFQIPEEGGLYSITGTQYFETSEVPFYSELEIEILDANYSHVYSVYKDLWRENHPNDDGIIKTYRDFDFNFDLAFEQGGFFCFRPISHNGNMGEVLIKIHEKRVGGLYLSYGMFIFGGMAILALIFISSLRNPFEHIDIVTKNWSLFFQRHVLVLFVVALLAFAWAWYAALNNIGYATFGTETRLPSFLFNKHNVIYLG